MAFEAFLERDDRRPRRRRRLTYAVSLMVHGVLLAGGIAYSFWRVEELSPPTVRVTFMSSVPPPPAAPPPAAAGGSPAPKKKAPTNRIKPTLTELVQPKVNPPKKEEPKPEPPDDDDPDQAIAGGTKGGGKGSAIIGGPTPGKPGGIGRDPASGVSGGPPKPLAPKMVAPQMGALQKSSGDDPDFPAVLRRHAGMNYLVIAQICVSRTGNVDSVTIKQSADPMLDGNVVRAVKGWRYRPLLADNNAVSFCYFGRFQFKSD